MHSLSSSTIAAAAVLFGSLSLAQNSSASTSCGTFGSFGVGDIFNLNGNLQPNSLGVDDPFEVIEAATYVFASGSLQYCIPNDHASSNISVPINAVVDASFAYITSCCPTHSGDDQCAGGSVPLNLPIIGDALTLEVRPITDDCTPNVIASSTNSLGPDIANAQGASVSAVPGSGIQPSTTGDGLVGSTAGEAQEGADAVAGDFSEGLLNKVIDGITTFFGNLFGGLSDKRKRSLAVARGMRG